MPPPPLPPVAGAFATIVSGKAIQITRDQGTGVSHSDISRGFTEALRSGLTVVDHRLADRVCKAAHEQAQWGDGHQTDTRFDACLACTRLYTAVNEAVETFRKVY